MEFKSRMKRLKYNLIIIVFVAFFVILFLWPYISISIKPGEAGVFYSRLFGGTDKSLIYTEGVHFIAPWDIIYIYDTRLQEYSETFNMLSSDGLTIGIKASIRYQVLPERLPELHIHIGPEYERIIISPTFTSAIREAIGNYRPDELYASARQEIQDKALISAVRQVSRLPVLINSIVVKSISLPPKINSAIETKLSEEQENLKYKFVLQKTFQEAKRKVIEAEGIRLYQQAINKGLTENFLRFKGIQATSELATSQNSKLVVIGGKDGMPLILNPDSLRTTTGEKGLRLDNIPAHPQQAPGNPSLNFDATNNYLNEIWQKIDQIKIPKDLTE